MEQIWLCEMRNNEELQHNEVTQNQPMNNLTRTLICTLINLYLILFYSPKVGTLLNSMGKIGSAIILTVSAYFIYTNYMENHKFSKNLHLNKRDSREQSTR